MFEQTSASPLPFQIKYTQDRDAGIYECQVIKKQKYRFVNKLGWKYKRKSKVSTSLGPISRRVQLNVIYPEAYIQVGLIIRIFGQTLIFCKSLMTVTLAKT